MTAHPPPGGIPSVADPVPDKLTDEDAEMFKIDRTRMEWTLHGPRFGLEEGESVTVVPHGSVTLPNDGAVASLAERLFGMRYVPWLRDQAKDIRKDCREDAEVAYEMLGAVSTSPDVAVEAINAAHQALVERDEALERLGATERAWEKDKALHWTEDGAEELVARVASLEAALREARKDVLAVNVAEMGPDRGALALAALRRIDAALVAAPSRPEGDEQE